MLTASFGWQTKSITLGKAPETISQACPFMTPNIYFLHSFANILQHVEVGLLSLGKYQFLYSYVHIITMTLQMSYQKPSGSL